MKEFKKCSAILRGDVDDLSIKSPVFEMHRLSSEVYKFTGLVKVRCPVLYIPCQPIIRIIRQTDPAS